MFYNVVTIILLCSVAYLLKNLLSSKPNNVKFQFKFFIFYFLTSLYCFVVWPFYLLNPKDTWNAKVATYFLRHITKIYSVKWELRNRDILAEDRGAVIMSNHQSSLDVLGQFNIWDVVDKMTVVAKKELFYIWPFGLTAYLGGIVFIDRNNKKSAYHQLNVISNVMIEKKVKIWMFPEGTRNKDFRNLLPFKKGAFVIAVNAQVPIIPVLFSPYYFIDAKKYIFNKGNVIIKCLEPVPTKGLTPNDIPGLMTRLQYLMQKEYKELSDEVFGALPTDYPHTTVK